MIREYKIRVDVIRNGATLTTLKNIDAPRIDCNAESVIKVSMAGIFEDNKKVNWLTDELKPVQIIDGVEYPVGVFPVGTKKDVTDDNGKKQVHLECYDRGKYLNEYKVEDTGFFIPAGTNYVAAVEKMLVDAGISLYIAEPTKEVLATDREDWEPGTPYLEIINQLLGEINYSQVWFNKEGFAIIRPVREPIAENLDHQYTTEDKIKILQQKAIQELDIFNAPNVFLLTCDNPDLPQPLFAKAENDNPLSALSIGKRGRRILQRIKVDNIPNQAALDSMAARIRTESMLAAETATISTANMPGHGVLDVVAVIHPDMMGIYQEVGWTLMMQPGGTMRHYLRRSRLI